MVKRCFKNLKSLHDSNQRKCCTTFAQTFTHKEAPVVDPDDFVSELKVLQITLLDDLSALEKLRFFSLLQLLIAVQMCQLHIVSF
jgi:hypothetical protein